MDRVAIISCALSRSGILLSHMYRSMTAGVWEALRYSSVRNLHRRSL